MRSVLVSDCKVAAGRAKLWVRPSERDEAFETCLDTSSEAKGRGHWRPPPPLPPPPARQDDDD